MRAGSAAIALASLAAAPAAQALLLEVPRRMLPGEGDETLSLALGDVDGNGALDLLVGNLNGVARTRLSLNDGHGMFRESGAVFPGDRDWTTAVGLADVDSDGDLDAFLGKTTVDVPTPPTSDGGAQNRIYLNAGTGTFVDRTAWLPVILDRTSGVALSDFDGDGHVDALLGGSPAHPDNNGFVTIRGDRLLLGDGAGAFVQGPALPGGCAELSDVADVDGDGDLDALYGCRLLRNDGAGMFTTATGAVPSLSDSGKFVFGDVDGDGDPDAFSGHHLYLNDGGGLFTDASGGLPAAPSLIMSVAMADVDGDTDLDALIGRADYYNESHDELLYIGDGGGGFVLALSVNAGNTRAGALADVDGDGDADAIFGNAGPWGNEGQDRLLLGRGDGTFYDTAEAMPLMIRTTEPIRTWGSAVEARDFDGDGELDLFLGREDGQNALFLGDGEGRFSDATDRLPVLSNPCRDVAAADVDMDGDPDVVVGDRFVANSPSAQLTYLACNDGAGGFSVDSGALPPFPDKVEAVGLGDLDGDGDPDALIGNSGGEPRRLLFNDGTGTFVDGSANLPDAYLEIEKGVELADLDGDGALDLFVGINNTSRIYGNDGLGVFTQRATINSPTVNTALTSIATGDIDQDGDTDLFFGQDALNSYPDFLRRNVGSFSFTNPGNLPQTPDTTYVADLADFDGDGDLDLLLGTGGTGNNGTRPYDQMHYLRNGGTGTFALADEVLDPQPTEWSFAIAIADFDRDGDADVLNNGRLYSNLTRHLAARGMPRAGHPLTLDLYGSPGASWLLRGVVSGATAHGASIRRSGVLGATILGGGVLDSAGRAAFVLPVPGGPAVVGRTIVWQARIGGGWSNVERTTFTDL